MVLILTDSQHISTQTSLCFKCTYTHTQKPYKFLKCINNCDLMLYKMASKT